MINKETWNPYVDMEESDTIYIPIYDDYGFVCYREVPKEREEFIGVD